jgi:hypothetical protein
MNPMSITTAIKLGAIVVVAVILYFVWHDDREDYAQSKVDEVVSSVRAEAERDAEEKLAVSNARVAALEAGNAAAAAEIEKMKEMLNDHKTVLAARDRVIGGLRGTLATARRNEVSLDPGSPCRPQELRAERLAGLLADGQSLCVEGAELLGEGVGLVLSGERGARTDATMIRWAQRTMDAMRIGAEPPQR